MIQGYKALAQIAAGAHPAMPRMMDLASMPMNPAPPPATFVVADSDSASTAIGHDQGIQGTSMGLLNAIPTVEGFSRVILGPSGPDLDVAEIPGTTRGTTSLEPPARSAVDVEDSGREADDALTLLPGPQAADLLSEFLPTSGVALVRAVDDFLASIDELTPPEEADPGLPIQVREPLAWLASGVAVEVIRRSFSRREKEKDEETKLHHDRPSWPGVPRFLGLPGR